MSCKTCPTGCSSNPGVSLDTPALDLLAPLNLLIGEDGTILHAGPTMVKVFPNQNLQNAAFFDNFRIVKPRSMRTPEDFSASLGQRIVVSPYGPVHRRSKPIRFNGLLLEAGSGTSGTPRYVLALTPGMELPRLATEFGTTSADVSPADGCSDLLFLIQMQQEFIKDSQALSDRLMAAKLEAERIAMCDMLTGLPNRRALTSHLEKLLSSGAGREKPIAVLHVDLDRFKQVNDTLGHAAGDAVLEHAARVLNEVVGDHGMSARIGGDEFVVALADAPGEETLMQMARKICSGLRQPVSFRDTKARIGGSVGIAVAAPGEATSFEGLLNEADLALYEVKRSGRGSARICSPEIRQRYDTFNVVSREIREGLERGEFVPFFQPQVNGRTGALIGVEVLARWHHPDRGLLTPGAFLHTAEMAGLVDQMDLGLRRAALDACRGWLDEGLAVPGMSINLTSTQLRNTDLAEQLTWEAEEAGVPGSVLCLEILEAVMFEENSEGLTATCEKLRRAGFRLSLDDFGTGHAAISTLINLPVSRVKIDRSFVHGISRNPRIRTITASMISMARSLEVAVLAEGVEDEADLRVMLELGCHDYQGYYFARPMSGDDFLDWGRARDLVKAPPRRDQVRRTLPM